MIEQFTEADLLRVFIHGATVFELLRTGLELELFEHLERAGGLDLPGVAAALKVDAQPARVLLLGLTALRLLEKEGDTYSNADITRKKLLRDSPRFLGPLVDVQSAIINRGIGDLSDAVRAHDNLGLRHLPGPGSTLYERLTAYPDLQNTYYLNMGDASRKSVPQLLEAFDFARLSHIVDLAGGDGSNGVALAVRHPHLTVTVFDQASVVPLAAERADCAGVGDRVRTFAGDIFADPLPGGTDAVLICHFFEIWSLRRNVKLLRRCYESLPSGGAVLIYNFVSADDGTGPLSAALMSAYFLTMASGEGMTYSAADMESAVREAGFEQVERYPDLGFGHALVVGYKR
jgi:hypothetical protein